MKAIALIVALMIANILASCTDFRQAISEMDVNATGNYDQTTGNTQAVVGAKFYFREPKRLPNYSKDK